MKPNLVQSRVASFLIAIVLLLQVTPALAGGPLKRGDDDRKDVDITFTKWITTFPLMAGFVGGDVVGGFSGEVLTHERLPTSSLRGSRPCMRSKLGITP